MKNCSSNLAPEDNAHSIRETLGDTDLLELLTKLTKSQSSELFPGSREIEHSNPGLACDFLISSLGLLGVLSLNKKNRDMIYKHETVIVVRDLLTQESGQIEAGVATINIRQLASMPASLERQGADPRIQVKPRKSHDLTTNEDNGFSS